MLLSVLNFEENYIVVFYKFLSIEANIPISSYFSSPYTEDGMIYCKFFNRFITT